MGAASDGSAPSRRFVLTCVATWVTISATCVLVNKHVLFYLKFGFPTTLAVLHMCAAFLSTSALIRLSPDGRRHLPSAKAPGSFYGQLAGISALFGLVLVLANSAFMYLSVPSIQMLKAGGAATTFCVGLAFGTERYSHNAALKVLIVGAGVLLASYGDVRANLVGVLLQVSSIVADAVRCTLLQLVMQHSEVKLTPVGTLYFVAPMSALILCLPAAFVELPRLLHHTAPIPWPWLAGSCAAASALNLVVFTLIGKTSALTTSITGPLKEWVCILTAMLVYGTPVTRQQWAGYAVALTGIAWYQRDKFFASEAARRGGGLGGADDGDEQLPIVQPDIKRRKSAHTLSPRTPDRLSPT
ncbi:plastidic phosphate translocator [Raphidocelis subcapitata]|uniref:Plastidic phosphate translocator n=1 Tax=Raphidocelis subcapitata TaxID=307507 RepID=A0A2V0PIB8_9CHLO|nr:plastidic phosphate translocator [Raphidocelis subcapitata]|eukprot:GBF99466.1 plastidic phosphate translocator [Raphidocelis subcapitata]